MLSGPVAFLELNSLKDRLNPHVPNMGGLVVRFHTVLQLLLSFLMAVCRSYLGFLWAIGLPEYSLSFVQIPTDPWLWDRKWPGTGFGDKMNTRSFDLNISVMCL